MEDKEGEVMRKKRRKGGRKKFLMEIQTMEKELRGSSNCMTESYNLSANFSVQEQLFPQRKR